MAEENSKNRHKRGGASLFIWGGTLLAAGAILGGSVLIAARKEKEVSFLGETARQVSVPAITASPAPSSASAPVEESVVVLADTVPATVARPRKLAGTLRLKVAFMDEREKMPLANTCFRENVSPALYWYGAPPETRSYALFMQKAGDENDTGRNWIVFDVPVSAQGLPGNLPKDFMLPGAGGGRQLRSDLGGIGYNGPCEASGVFRYVLRLFALDTVLDLPPDTTEDETLLRAMEGHILDETAQEFTHYYKM